MVKFAAKFAAFHEVQKKLFDRQFQMGRFGVV
jgi:hypothetical protein